jgi:hypothetical protein
MTKNDKIAAIKAALSDSPDDVEYIKYLENSDEIAVDDAWNAFTVQTDIIKKNPSP